MFYSALDQHYHGQNASSGGRTTDVLQQVQKQYYGLPYVENTVCIKNKLPNSNKNDIITTVNSNLVDFFSSLVDLVDRCFVKCGVIFELV